MSRSLILAFVVFAIVLGATTSIASAQATRTWVSGVGDDANPCSRTAPCKTWAGAYSKTATGGEMDALDPGGFGTLTIGHAITIDGGGGQVASVLVSGTPGITVNAGPSDVVILRNLRLQGITQSGEGGTSGVSYQSGGRLAIEDCYITNFTNAGISVAAAAKADLEVTHTTVDGNQGGGIIITATGSGSVHASIDSSQIIGNGALTGATNPGVEASGLTRVIVSNSNIAENRDGLYATGTGAIMFVTNSSVSNNSANGLHASSSGQIASAQSTIFANALYGVLADTSGTVSSFGNNYVHANSSGSGTFSAPVLSPTIRFRLPSPP